MREFADKGEGVKKSENFADIIYGSPLSRGHLENVAIFFGRPISSLDTRDPRGKREGKLRKRRGSHAKENPNTKGLREGEANTQVMFAPNIDTAGRD